MFHSMTYTPLFNRLLESTRWLNNIEFRYAVIMNRYWLGKVQKIATKYTESFRSGGPEL